MKNFLFALVLLPLALCAQPYKGTLTLNDGLVKTGLFDVPGYSDSKIKFKNADGKTEKASVKDVSGLTFVTDAGETVNYLVLTAANLTGYTARSNNKMFWCKVHKTGKVNLVSMYFDYSAINMFGDFNAAAETLTGNAFFLNKAGDKIANYVYTNNEADKLHVYNFKQLDTNIKAIYGNKCAEFAETFNGYRGAVEKEGLTALVGLYEEYCD